MHHDDEEQAQQLVDLKTKPQINNVVDIFIIEVIILLLLLIWIQ